MELMIAETRRLLHRRAVWLATAALMLTEVAVLVPMHPGSWSNAISDATQVGTVFGIIIAMLTCATYVGAEYSSGSLATWLTFEPSRLRVYGSKMLTAAAWSLIVGLVAMIIPLVLAVLFSLGRYGELPVVDLSDWLWLGQPVLALLVVIWVGLASSALAFITRSAAGVVGLAAGYLVVFEALVASILRVGSPYLLSTNITAFITGQYSTGYSYCGPFESNCDWATRVVERPEAGMMLSIILVGLIAASLLVFRNRDIN